MLTINLLKANTSKHIVISTIVRNGHTIRGKRPGVARSLAQRLADDERNENTVLLPRVNIGFACKTPSRKEVRQSRIEHLKKQKQNQDLERLSRSNSLSINLDAVRKESNFTAAPFQLKTIADHYGIYKDLFGNAYFIPRINMDIFFTDENKNNHSIFYGNVLSASCTVNEPNITFDHNKNLLIKNFDSSETSYWSILMVSPDTHLFSGKNENFLNWFIGNIPNGGIKNGEEICKYLQPIPAKGFGFQRNVFILFRQSKLIDFQKFKNKSFNDLLDRHFNVLEFYREHQENITPAGLSFFQSEWDESVTKIFNKLNIKEPSFTYDFPRPYLADQKWFPLKQPFNLYMDKHRADHKKINKNYLNKYLFKDIDVPIKYPMAHPIKGVPSWMIAEIKKERLKLFQKMDKS
ncbi:39S ribosomal protein L38, mitochondrial [Condylostylus longicornis]|uniref:39S ribosomal protein L38, mitochondrial n=1 Tax=Condylostylus longicornis TaxID=2530218 RepID=UPI00244DECEE|nr:39S ribosomal protein L38, mitochondrial [Condylostylus longicornis]